MFIDQTCNSLVQLPSTVIRDDHTLHTGLYALLDILDTLYAFDNDGQRSVFLRVSLNVGQGGDEAKRIQDR